MADAPNEPQEPQVPLAHDESEAGEAAASPTTDRRRPRLHPGLAGDDLPPLSLEDIAAHVAARFPQLTSDIVHGELTFQVPADLLRDVLAFCRDDDTLRTTVLADLSGVHWPAGEHVVERQPATTGWPEYRVSREVGVIEVLYVLRSLDRNHWFRLSVGADDTDPRLPTVTDLFATASYHEREVWDFFGVVFEGHPGLTRILMPDDWVGHPQRKDYPLGGVNINYENDKFIPPPEQRALRVIVGGES